MEWGVLYNYITTFSRLTTGLFQLPNYLLTNHKDTKEEKAMPLTGSPAERYANAYTLWRFLQAITYHNFTTISNIKRSHFGG